MGHEIVYCGRCQTRLSGTDFEKGTAIRTSTFIGCVTCLTDAEKAGLKKVEKSSGAHPTARRSTNTPARSTPIVPVEPTGSGLPKPLLIGGGAGVLVLIVVILVLVFRGGKPPAPTDPPLKVSADLPPTQKPPAAAGEKDFRPELDAVAAELQAPIAQRNFRFALLILDRSRERHAEPRWTQAIGDLQKSVMDHARARHKEILAAAAKAAERMAPDELRDLRAEIARWGDPFAELLREFDAAYGAALAVAPVPPPVPDNPPDPAPPKPPDPGPVVVPDPGRSDAGKRYLDSWEKAMFAASRRDFDRAIADLRVAGRGFKEDDVQKENAADLQDLERLKALQPDLTKSMSTLPSWEEIAIDVTKEDGSRAPIKARILQAGPQRLELRGELRYVELEDIALSSMAKIHAQKRKQTGPDDARLTALLCALDGDPDARSDETLPPKFRNYATTVRTKLPEADAGARQKEWAARKLFYEAEAEFRSLETRGAALEKYGRLLANHADTSLVRRSNSEIAARTEEVRDYVFTIGRLLGKGVLVAQKMQVVLGKDKLEMTGWKSKEDPAADDSSSAADVTFYGVPNVEYKAWALVGGCCATTFTWYLQANELTYVDKKTRKTLNCDPGSNFAAPWEHKMKGLSTTHGGKNHLKAEKEPVIWEWVDLPPMKFSSGGPKSIRLMPMFKGMAAAAIVVSANREKRPTFEETKKFTEIVVEEAVSTSNLRAGKGEPDLLIQIPEARPYVLVYDVDLAKLRRPPQYDIDNHATVAKGFDRIAYLVELQKGGGPMQYVFVSMEAFTDDPGKVGIPEGWKFQQKIAAMNVHSNVEGVATGIGLDGGNIEFWPSNYGPANGAGIPGASASAFDFGDQPGDPFIGYGCMQVHNYKAGHTIFAINKWNSGGGELGIGNSKTGNPDYTFTNNGNSYSFKRLRVLVRPRN